MDALSWSWDGWLFILLLFVEGLAVITAWLVKKNNGRPKIVFIFDIIVAILGVFLIVLAVVTALKRSEEIFSSYRNFLILPIFFGAGLASALFLGLKAIFILGGRTGLYRISHFLKASSIWNLIFLILAAIALITSFFLSVWGTKLGSWSWYSWLVLISLILASFISIVEFIAAKSKLFQKIAISFLQGFLGLLLLGFSIYALRLDLSLIADSIPYFPLTMILHLLAPFTGILLGILCILDLLKLFKTLPEKVYNSIFKVIRFPKFILGLLGFLISLYLIIWIYEKWSL